MTDSIFKNDRAGRFVVSNKSLLPRRKTKGSACYDFVSPKTVVVPARGMIQFDSEVKVEMREGFVLELYIRSSLGKHGISLINSVGIIDSDFHDSMQAMIINHSDEPYTINKGDRYMQGKFARHYLTDDDHTEAVRTGGLGSTGR